VNEDAWAIVAILAIIALSVWMTVAGPCWLYSFASAGDVPARCLVDFIR
jgi:hypothetical protein